MPERQNVTVPVHSSEAYGHDFPANHGTKLVNLLSWMRKMLLSVPTEYRDIATCAISSVSGYEGCHSATIEIEYLRPETDEEMADRLIMQEARWQHERDRELSTLQALKSKYPDAP